MFVMLNYKKCAYYNIYFYLHQTIKTSGGHGPRPAALKFLKEKKYSTKRPISYVPTTILQYCYTVKYLLRARHRKCFCMCNNWYSRYYSYIGMQRAVKINWAWFSEKKTCSYQQTKRRIYIRTHLRFNIIVFKS